MNIEQFVKERDAALATLDLNEFKIFYTRMKKEGMYDVPFPNDGVAEIAMYKCATADVNLPMEIRRKADAWLKERRYESFLGIGEYR